MKTFSLLEDITELSLDEPQQKVFDGQPFPIIITPEEHKLTTIEETQQWLRKSQLVLKDLALQYGAILFRGFAIESPEHFDQFVKEFQFEPLPYVGGAAPRRVITGNVFTANEAPPDQLIPFHHEMAQVPTFPFHLFFYCDVEPLTGGQTPIALSNEVYKTMSKTDKLFVEELEEKGVVYNRVLPENDDPASPIGRGWKSTYQTNDRNEAEKKCLEQETSFDWMSDGCLRTRTTILPAIRIDDRTGKKTWFNSIIAAYLGWQDTRNDRKKAVTFPDGTLMPEKSMERLEEAFEEIAVDFVWRKGDVLMVDNKQVLHGRRTFTPPRRILAALCK